MSERESSPIQVSKSPATEYPIDACVVEMAHTHSGTTNVSLEGPGQSLTDTLGEPDKITNNHESDVKRVNFLRDFPNGSAKSQLVIKPDANNTTLLYPTRRSLSNHKTNSVKMNKEMTPKWNFFEIEILEDGQQCNPAIGIAHAHFPLRSMPGLVRNSIGYHADDGTVYRDAGKMSSRGPICRKGDVMGCGIDFSMSEDQYVEVWFTRRSKVDGIEKIAISPQKIDFTDGYGHGKFHPVICISLHRDENLSDPPSKESVRYLGHSQRIAPDNKHSTFYHWYEVEGFECEGYIPFYDREASLNRYGAWNCTSSNITDHVKELDRKQRVLSFRNSKIYQELCSKFSLGASATTHQQWLQDVTQKLRDDEEFLRLANAPNGQKFKRNDHVAVYVATKVLEAMSGLCSKDRAIPLFLSVGNDDDLFMDVYAVSGLLYMGCSPDAKFYGHHSFHLGNSPVCMKLLLNWGGDPNVKNPAGKTFLHIRQNNLTLMRMFVEHCGAIPLDMNPLDKSGLAPIHVSAKCGLISTAEYLMQKGANPLTKTKLGHTACYIAAKSGYLECFRRMIKIAIEQEAEKSNAFHIIKRWKQMCKSLQSKWQTIKPKQLEDFSTEQLYVATVNSRVRMIDDTSYHDSKDSLISDYDYEEELSWKAGDRISVRRFLSLAETYQKEISPEVIHVLLDRCLFGGRLVMTDILDADIDGYLPGNQVNGLNSSNPTSTTLGPSRCTGTRLYHENDRLRTKNWGRTKWATPTRNITLSMYLSERPNLFYELIGHPTLRTHLHHKWNTMAKYTFWVWLCYYVFQMIMLTFALSIAARPSLTDQQINTYPDTIDIWRGICEAIVVACMLLKILDEILELQTERWNYFVDVSNYLQWTAVLLTLLIIPFRVAALPGQWIVASLAYIAHGCRAFLLAAFIKLTGAYIQSLFIIIGRDIIRFMAVLTMVFIVFSGSFYLAARHDDSVIPANGTTPAQPGGGAQADLKDLVLEGRTEDLPGVFLIGVRILAEAASVLDYYSETRILRPLTIILYLLFSFTVTIVLLNVLIAQVSNTYSKVQSTAEGVYLYYRCKFIARLEQQNQRLRISSQYYPYVPRFILQLSVGCLWSVRLGGHRRMKTVRNHIIKCWAKVVNCFKAKSAVTVYPKLLWIPGSGPVEERSKMNNMFDKLLKSFIGQQQIELNTSSFNGSDQAQDLANRVEELVLKLDSIYTWLDQHHVTKDGSNDATNARNVATTSKPQRPSRRNSV